MSWSPGFGDDEPTPEGQPFLEAARHRRLLRHITWGEQSAGRDTLSCLERDGAIVRVTVAPLTPLTGTSFRGQADAAPRAAASCVAPTRQVGSALSRHLLVGSDGP